MVNLKKSDSDKAKIAKKDQADGKPVAQVSTGEDPSEVKITPTPEKPKASSKDDSKEIKIGSLVYKRPSEDMGLASPLSAENQIYSVVAIKEKGLAAVIYQDEDKRQIHEDIPLSKLTLQKPE